MSQKIGKYGILNTETGEIVPYRPKGKHNNKIIYALYFPSQLTVMDYLVKFMSSTNMAEVKRTEALQILKISDKEYTGTIKRLLNENFCIRLGNNRFFINPVRFMKTARGKFPKLNAIYLELQNQQQKEKIAELSREPRQYAKRVNRHNPPILKIVNE